MIKTTETTKGVRGQKPSSSSVPSVATLYYYSDNWQVLAEYDGSGSFQAYYVFGNTIDEVLLRHVIPAQAGIQDFYTLHDHLYSPVALLDDTGAVVERYEYDAYGKAAILVPNSELRTFTTGAVICTNGE